MKDSNIAQACHILNQMISECSNHADAFSLLEFEWLCSKSFNLARQFLSRGDAETSRGILSSMHEVWLSSTPVNVISNGALASSGLQKGSAGQPGQIQRPFLH